MSKAELDELIVGLVSDCLDNQYRAMRGSLPWERANERRDEYIDKAKQALYQLLLDEVVGKRTDTNRFTELSKYAQRKILIEYELRAEQRQKLAELFGVES